MTQTDGEERKYFRDVLIRVTGNDRENVYWEAVMIENNLKPSLRGNKLSFVSQTWDVQEMEDGHAATLQD